MAAIEPNPLFIVPFALLLASIALAPFIAKHQWEKHYAKVAVGLGLVVFLYYTLALKAPGHVGETMLEYLSFMSLIGSLFVVCGGIHISVSGESKPWNNALYLLVGSIMANVVGTTGASMLLVRPWVRMNKFRYAGFHTAFFIFLVSNTGGCLTPVGDPPLFLGYLKGVPFFWTLEKLWIPWLLVTLALLVAFMVFDTININRVPKEVRLEKTAHESWSFRGMHNLGFLGIILAAVFVGSPWRELVMVGAAVCSYYTTSQPVHEANDFSFGPIKEVAWLFLGIFATMVPALDYLSVHSRELGISTPLAFYFAAGGLSSVLDNAPTYLTFLATSMGQYLHPLTQQPLNVNVLGDMQPHYLQMGEIELIAISLGAVWFGAMTYIGNGPNLMVKAVIEQTGCKTPHFLEYIYRYSVPVLLPLLAILGALVFVLWR